MYGLKQAAIIAYSNIISHMDPHGYYTVPFTTVLWAHKTRRTIFFLCVDDFGVKYFTKDDANHILDSLKITMCSQQIGRVTINSDWQYIGTIARNMFTYRWQNMGRKLWIDSNIINQKDPNMPKIAGHSPPMEKYSKWHQIHMIGTSWQEIHQNNTVYCGNHAIVYPVSWSNNATINQWNIASPIKCNRGNWVKRKNVTRLCKSIPKWNHPL